MSHTNGGIPWDDLSDSATRTVAWWVHQLAEGASLRVSFQCSQGGVSSITVEKTVEKNDDGSRKVHVTRYTPQDLEEIRHP